MLVRTLAALPARLCLLLPAVVLAAALAGPARCQTLLTSRASLSGTDRLDWAGLGDRATRISDPFGQVSSLGTAVIVSEAGHGLTDSNGGLFATLLQAGNVQAEGTLNGNFAPGDRVLDAMDGGTVSLSFPRGVYGGGAQLAVPTTAASGAGAFTVQVQAFGKDGGLLASFTRNGTFSARGDNSAPFVGILDAAPDIYRIAYTGLTPHYSLFLNRFDIATAPAAAATSHTHLLWNNTDGRVMLWSIAADGSFTLHGFGPYTGNKVPSARRAPGGQPAVVIPPDSRWSATALATGPDGKSHLLWNSTDGRVMLWTVDDAGVFTLAIYGPYTDGAASNKWTATAVSVGPDNVTHLLWNNTDNRVMLWNVDPSFNFTLAGFGPYTDNGANNLWSAAAVATGPDNVSRIAWNNTDGRVMLWDVAPDFTFTLAGYGPYTDGAAGNKWSAVGLSVGPDNLTHLLWGNTDHRAMLWNVDSAFGFSLAGYGPYTDNAPGNLWSAAALATGLDGMSHLLWGNTDNRAMLWGMDSAFDFTVAGYGPYTDNGAGNLWNVTAVSAGP